MSTQHKTTSHSGSSSIEQFPWEQQKVIKPVKKVAISIRIDHDILDWFREQSNLHGFKGYQSYINAVLRSFYEAKQPEAIPDSYRNGASNGSSNSKHH